MTYDLVIAPGEAPTHDDPHGGRRWHYVTPEGEKMEPPTYLYQHTDGSWGGECDGYIYPDGYSPEGPATRDHIVSRIEERLAEMDASIIRPRDPRRLWIALGETTRHLGGLQKVVDSFDNAELSAMLADVIDRARETVKACAR